MAKDTVNDSMINTLNSLPAGPFSTYDFIQEYRARFPKKWDNLEATHGTGGKGAGRHRTVFTQIAHVLSRLAREGELEKLNYRPAPDNWGNREIQYWSLDSSQPTKSDDSAAIDPEYREGTLRLKTHLRRERHWGLAKKKKVDFIKRHGVLFCEICKINPGEAFGLPIGNAVIEVHHASTTVGEMSDGHITKLSDLQCLCANCHRLVHARISAAKNL